MNKMNGILTKTTKIFAAVSILVLVLAGCAAQTGQTSRSFDENWRFVPSIHVEENSFGVTSGAEYRNCSYDMYYSGYWCPVR